MDVETARQRGAICLANLASDPRAMQLWREHTRLLTTHAESLAFDIFITLDFDENVIVTPALIFRVKWLLALKIRPSHFYEVGLPSSWREMAETLEDSESAARFYNAYMLTEADVMIDQFGMTVDLWDKWHAGYLTLEEYVTSMPLTFMPQRP